MGGTLNRSTNLSSLDANNIPRDCQHTFLTPIQRPYSPCFGTSLNLPTSIIVLKFVCKIWDKLLQTLMVSWVDWDGGVDVEADNRRNGNVLKMREDVGFVWCLGQSLVGIWSICRQRKVHVGHAFVDTNQFILFLGRAFSFEMIIWLLFSVFVYSLQEINPTDSFKIRFRNHFCGELLTLSFLLI